MQINSSDKNLSFMALNYNKISYYIHADVIKQNINYLKDVSTDYDISLKSKYGMYGIPFLKVSVSKSSENMSVLQKFFRKKASTWLPTDCLFNGELRQAIDDLIKICESSIKPKCNEIDAFIAKDDELKKLNSINPYNVHDMYNFLNKLYLKNMLTSEYFSTPVDKDKNTLLMYIADIPYDINDAERKYEYQQILKIIKGTSKINFEQKDKFGVTFLEKVINSENIELLNILKYKKLKYNPIYEFAYKRVENPQFKEELKNIKLSFPELKKAVELNSTKYFETVKQQLDSPFCDSKKEAKKLYNIAQRYDNPIILSYLQKYI